MNLQDLKIKKFPLLKEGIVLTLFFFMITLVFNIWFYSPSKKEIKGLKVDIERLNSNIADYKAFASSAENESKRLKDVVKAYEDMESRLLFSKEQIPSEKEVSNILKELSSPRPGLTLVIFNQIYVLNTYQPSGILKTCKVSPKRLEASPELQH